MDNDVGEHQPAFTRSERYLATRAVPLIGLVQLSAIMQAKHKGVVGRATPTRHAYPLKQPCLAGQWPSNPAGPSSRVVLEWLSNLPNPGLTCRVYVAENPEYASARRWPRSGSEYQASVRTRTSDPSPDSMK